jgi:hypothetical protein
MKQRFRRCSVTVWTKEIWVEHKLLVEHYKQQAEHERKNPLFIILHQFNLHGTGSTPPQPHHGLQRKTRFAVRNAPRISPCFFSAVVA